MPYGYETRVASTQQLLELMDTALELGLDRIGDKSLVTSRADENGYHILSIIVPNHVRPILAGTHPDPLHHRVQVIMKVRGTAIPDTFVLDVTEAQFRMLGTVNEVKEQQRAALPDEG